MSAVSAVPDVEAILPEGGRIEIDGIQCTVKRLKAREFLGLVRVVINGFGQEAVGRLRFDLENAEVMQQQILALLMVAVPNAMEEFIAFVCQIVEPVDKKNRSRLLVVLDNPDLDVLMEVAAIMAVQEKDDLSSLVGKAQALWANVSSIYGTRAVEPKE